LGVKPDQKGLEFFVDEKVAMHPEEITLPEKFVGLALGAAHPTKQIPISILKKIIQTIPSKFVLLGGKAEALLGEKLTVEFPEKVINCAGKTTLMQSAGIIRSCHVLITPDTGMMHLAVALQKPVVVVWGSTVPDFGMFPYYPGNPKMYSNIEVTGLKCRPCSKLGKTSCPKRHFDCMNKIDVEEIFRAVEPWIN